MENSVKAALYSFGAFLVLIGNLHWIEMLINKEARQERKEGTNMGSQAQNWALIYRHYNVVKSICRAVSFCLSVA